MALEQVLLGFIVGYLFANNNKGNKSVSNSLPNSSGTNAPTPQPLPPIATTPHTNVGTSLTPLHTCSNCNKTF